MATKEHVGLAAQRWASGTAFATARPARERRSSPGRNRRSLATLVVVPHFAPAGSSAFESRYDSPRSTGPISAPSPRCFSRLHSCHSSRLSRCWPRCPSSGEPALVSPHPDLRQDARRRRGRPALLAAAVFGAAGWAAARVLRRADGPHRMLLLARSAAWTSAPRARSGRPARARGHPRGVPVSATTPSATHLSDRRRIFSFPLLREAHLVVVDEQRLTFSTA